jgi:hypothetical protein
MRLINPIAPVQKVSGNSWETSGVPRLAECGVFDAKPVVDFVDQLDTVDGLVGGGGVELVGSAD